MKKFFLGLALFFAFSGVALAEHSACGTSSCPMGSQQCAKGGESEESQCPIMGKLMKKAHFLLKNGAEIELSDEQVATIKQIKTQAQKNSIQQGADMQIFMLDMKSKLAEDELDVEGINAMIDKGSAEMAEAGKSAVALYAELKAVLTPEQLVKAKALWKK